MVNLCLVRGIRHPIELFLYAELHIILTKFYAEVKTAIAIDYEPERLHFKSEMLFPLLSAMMLTQY